jgi:Cof subfamily protein (haloacid dehalogenase superfamily)
MSRKSMGALPPRLIICDVDGTLLDPQAQLRREVEQAVLSAAQAGVMVTLASGRNKTQVDTMALELGLTPPVISLGGACVALPDGSTPLRHRIIHPERAHRLVMDSRRLGLGVMVQTFTENLLESDAETAAEIHRIASGFVQNVEDILAALDEPVSKITLIGPAAGIAGIQASIDRDPDPLHTALSGERFLDVTAAGADKGSSVRFLIEHLGLDPSGVAAIGDGHNDISMFIETGTSIAMGNALDEVKQAAHLVAPPNSEAGAAWAIQRLLNYNRG